MQPGSLACSGRLVAVAAEKQGRVVLVDADEDGDAGPDEGEDAEHREWPPSWEGVAVRALR